MERALHFDNLDISCLFLNRIYQDMRIRVICQIVDISEQDVSLSSLNLVSSSLWDMSNSSE